MSESVWWADPYNRTAEGNPIPYGGGICDLPRVVAMACDAKRAGLKVLLNLHYSDFWAHPGQQVIPKEWAGVKTEEEMSAAVQGYTVKVLKTMDEAGALPDMVQIGNETSTGMLLNLPGKDSPGLTGGNPGYISGKTDLSSDIAGTDSGNFVKYVKAANEAIKEYNSEILTAVHYAPTHGHFDVTSFNFFKSLKDENIDFDVIGLSYYLYYHGEIEAFKKDVKKLSETFPDKMISIFETSYGYTDALDADAGNVFWSMNTQSGTARAVYGYEVSPQGQANVIHDQLSALYEAVGDRCGGIFYWAGCWTPVSGVGWGDADTKNSWSNQALFSYEGKALPSLSVFQKLIG